MIKRINFSDTFIPDDPDANPYFGIAAYIGTDITAEEQFQDWQRKNKGKIEIKGISEKENGDIIVFYRERLSLNVLANKAVKPTSK